ncbi:MAG: 16S rRNA (cytosine(1402)-N(4))-methyltransferase RsmH [Bacteroidaceae bacterium]|nr:16S rRNA (cytosine(1402)-N(4))-methyltransferase RsmH [Bacteroidaceae bacterium]
MKVAPYHTPVLLKPAVAGLLTHLDGVYVDVTFGGGGHSGAILEQLSEGGHLYSFDQDADAQANTEREPFCSRRGQFTFVRSNFRYLHNWMRYYGVEQIDGLLADLGVSSHHFDTEDRGFSFRFDAPLDMRMNQRGGQTAADLVNKADAEVLTRIFRFYGELRQANRLADAIVRERAKGEIKTTGQLADILSPLCSREHERKDLTKVFQALRIEVNHEMDALQEMLMAAIRLLAPGGRLVVLSYHSIEDRIVKNLMRAGNLEGKVERDFFGRTQAPLIPLGKPVIPSAEELEMNPRSRSAKLRVAAKPEE